MLNLVVGMGIVGTALAKLIALNQRVLGIDLEPDNLPAPVHTLHICYPYSDKFVSEVVRYVEAARPELCIIHSTVAPGTTGEIAIQTRCALAYSPVRGRHNTMLMDLLKYKKFVASIGSDAQIAATTFLESVGFSVKEFSSCRGLELTKLIETTYSGLLIAWAQEMNRFAGTVDTDYFEIMRFLSEISYLPPVVFQPGYIGGHCIINNLGLLDEIRQSPFIDCIRQSNAQVEPSEKQLYPVHMALLGD